MTTRHEVMVLEHTRPEVAEEIRRLMVDSYRVEGEILGVDDFVPLRRTATHIAATEADFLGIRIDGILAAVVEVEAAGPGHLHLGSLVVQPTHFRRGLATSLLNSIVVNHPSSLITVSTGAANVPALHLYRGHGFDALRRWTTADGIPMLTLARKPE